MYAKKYVILFVMLVGALVSGCATIQDVLDIRKPKVSMKGLKFGEVTLKSTTLLFDVEIENPYPAALPLVNMDYSLASNAQPFLSGKADLQSTIPAHGKETVTLPATISYLDLIQAYKVIRPGSTVPYSADLGLSVDAPNLGLLRLPMKKEGELLVPAMPKIR